MAKHGDSNAWRWQNREIAKHGDGKAWRWKNREIAKHGDGKARRWQKGDGTAGRRSTKQGDDRTETTNKARR